MAGENLINPMYLDKALENHWVSEPIALNNDFRVQLMIGTAASGDRPNEDAYAAHLGPDGLYVATFDGATSLLPVEGLPDGETGARFASHFLRNRLHEIVTEQPDIPPGDLMLALNEMLFAEYVRRGLDASEFYRMPGSTATIFRLGRTATTAEFAHVGDGIAWTHSDDGTSELVTVDRNAPFDKAVLDLMGELVFEHGVSPKEARKHPDVVEALVAARVYKDNRFDGTGTGIINGDPNLEIYVRLGLSEIDLETLKMWISVTDGMLPSLIRAERAEARDMIHKYLETERGFLGVVRRTRAVENADPDLWNQRLKPHDDATGAAVEIL